MEKEFRWFFITLFVLTFSSCLLASIDTLTKFTFEDDNRFIKTLIPVSSNATKIYGLFESSDSSIVFELRFGSNSDVINLPAGDVEISLESATGFCPEDPNQNETDLHIEIEIEATSFTVRSRNAEQYSLETPLMENEHFRILFFSSDDNCVLPAITSMSSQSYFQLPSEHHLKTVSPSPSASRSTKRSRFNFNAEPTTYPSLQRTATMRSAFARTTSRYAKVRFATYKMLPVKTTPSPKEVAYIDILKDREVYEQVQRSETREINNVWSPTFLLFFGAQTLIIGSFVIFGFIMFIILQCRPRDALEHKPLHYDP